MHEEFWEKYPPIPDFDCVKMKHELQAKVYESIKGMTSQELVAYFQQRPWDNNASAVHESPGEYENPARPG